MDNVGDLLFQSGQYGRQYVIFKESGMKLLLEFQGETGSHQGVRYGGSSL